jgi:hypothetical protein
MEASNLTCPNSAFCIPHSALALMSTAPSRPVARRRWPKWVPIAGWSLLGLLGATLLVYMATVTFGAVHGIEFCPQTFERRSYSFYELPILGIQITGNRREDLTAAAETFLTSQKYIAPPAAGQQDWHIVVGSRGPRLQRRGDAHILIQYLDAKDGKDYHRWVKWSEDHPSLAKIFWPAVQRLAAHELYVFIPDLFDLAKAIDDPVKLQQELDRDVARRLLFLARRLQDREDHAAAIKVLTEAAPLDPENKEIQRARDTSRVAAKANEQ